MAWVPSLRDLLPAGPNATYCFGYIGKEDTRCVSSYVLRIELDDGSVARWQNLSEWSPNEYQGVGTDGMSLYMTTSGPLTTELSEKLVRLQGDGRWAVVHDPDEFGATALLVTSIEHWVLSVNNRKSKTLIHFDGGTIRRFTASERVSEISALDSDRLVAACGNGLVMLFDGERWIEIIDTPTDVNLVAIHVSAPDEVWFGGWKSTVLRWNGKDRWKLWNTAGTQNASSIASYKGVIYVGCATDGIFRLEGDGFVKVSDIFALSLLVHGDYLITSGGGRSISIYDGSTWRTETLEFEPRYTAELDVYYQDWDKKYGNIY